MTLCWTLDKLGPLTRSVEDTMLVLQGDQRAGCRRRGQRARHLDYACRRPVKGLKVGYFPDWMKQAPATDVDRAALQDAAAAGPGD